MDGFAIAPPPPYNSLFLATTVAGSSSGMPSWAAVLGAPRLPARRPPPPHLSTHPPLQLLLRPQSAWGAACCPWSCCWCPAARGCGGDLWRRPPSTPCSKNILPSRPGGSSSRVSKHADRGGRGGFGRLPLEGVLAPPALVNCRWRGACLSPALVNCQLRSPRRHPGPVGRRGSGTGPHPTLWGPPPPPLPLLRPLQQPCRCSSSPSACPL